jgi:hypothetical protein
LSVLADKIETESIGQPDFAPSLRPSAERNLTLAKLHKKKKSNNPKWDSTPNPSKLTEGRGSDILDNSK